MLTNDMFPMPIPLLPLDHDPDRLPRHAHDPRATHKQPLIHIPLHASPLLAVLANRHELAGRCFERVVARADYRSARESQRVADVHAVQEGREPDRVAERDVVGFAVDVDDGVEGWLGAEEREERVDGWVEGLVCYDCGWFGGCGFAADGEGQVLFWRWGLGLEE